MRKSFISPQRGNSGVTTAQKNRPVKVMTIAVVVRPDGSGHKRALEALHIAPRWGGWWLNELPICHSSSYRADRVIQYVILSLILLSATDSRLSSSSPTSELALLTSLLSLPASPALMPSPQHTIAKNRTLPTTDW